VPREEKGRAFHEEEKRLQKFPGVTNLNRNEGIDHSQQSIVHGQQSTNHRRQTTDHGQQTKFKAN
jgi:hypothetical protein